MHITSCSLFCNNHGDGNYESDGNYGSDTIAPIIPIIPIILTAPIILIFLIIPVILRVPRSSFCSFHIPHSKLFLYFCRTHIYIIEFIL